ncbi:MULTISPECIES: TetR/AcrR family transcriptional regulator [Corynebacterium]|uniref:TetR/AcrR family transcriptional regulator n=1 Tax=Corynebacterium TaxID=1716 RepID=UPI000A798E37|nr:MULTISPECIES: TetR/AcrR family transcriptional regulator [Corynebacterium]MDK8870031.1 TetR/AcrR family transcriptional regulator [Corynebacterium macclintockiae]
MRTSEQHIDTAAWMQAIFNRSEQGGTRRERTRLALLRAGIELIAEERTDLSILAITQKAGVSNGSFYNFFKDRNQFFDAVAEYAVNHLAIIFDLADAPDLDSIDAAATNIRILAFAHRLVPTLSKSIVRRSPDFYTMPNELVRQLRERISAGVEDGSFHVASTESAAAVIFGASAMLGQRLHEDPELNSRIAGDDLALDLLRMLGVSEQRAKQAIARPIDDYLIPPQ